MTGLLWPVQSLMGADDIGAMRWHPGLFAAGHSLLVWPVDCLSDSSAASSLPMGPGRTATACGERLAPPIFAESPVPTGMLAAVPICPLAVTKKTPTAIIERDWIR
jgi:hypothetical protein